MDQNLQSPLRQAPASPAIVWWIVWGAILTGLGTIYLFLGQPSRSAPPTVSTVLDYIVAGPLVLSSVIRWLWFPRIRKAAQAFVIFIIGIALAESTGILGIFLTSQQAVFAALGALGIVQWIPLFVDKYQAD